MCDHKLEINSATNNKEDLVTATIFFDLIQSNIHKTMTLHLGNHKPDMKTSCKGWFFTYKIIINFSQFLLKHFSLF